MARSLLTVLMLVGLGGAVTALAVRWEGEEASVETLERVDVPPMDPSILLVVDGADPYIGGPLEQTQRALDRASLDYVLHDLADDPQLPDLAPFEAVLTVVERLGQISPASADRLEGFVDGGGGLVVVHRGWSARLARLLGFASDAPPVFDTPAESVTFTTALMPGGDNLTMTGQALSSYATEIRPECETLAVRGSNDDPTVWTCPRGEGRVVYWNAALLGTKPYRGFLLQSLALVHPAHVRPIANWAVVYLDDFPSPASNGQVAPIWQESKQTPAQFYAETWYPDMERFAEQYDLRYTSALIFAYNGQTRPPFPMNEWLAGRIHVKGSQTPYSPWIAVESAREDEMGFHGYNHQSLLTRLWGSQDAMEMALRVARERWEYERIAPMPRTYVPPMNWIDSTGTAALLSVFPEIETIASLYTGPFAEGQGREYGPEPWAPGVYALPRNTSGFILTDGQRLLMLSVLQTVGGWGHFVHPDEVFANADRERTYALMGLPPPGEIGWYGSNGEGFHHHFGEWLAFARAHYPWLESVTAAEATTRMRILDDLDLAWESQRDEAGRRLDIRASYPRQVVVTWAEPGETLSAVSGADVLHTWDGPIQDQVVLRLSGTEAALRFSIDREATASGPPPTGP